MKHILSFDIAKGKSVYCFINELRNTIIDATLIEHKKDDFDSLYKIIKKYDKRKVLFLVLIFNSKS